MDTPALCRLQVFRGILMHGSHLCQLSFNGRCYPRSNGLVIRTSQSRKPSAFTIAGRKYIWAHATRSSSRSRPFVKFYSPVCTDCFKTSSNTCLSFCNPRSLSIPCWVTTCVLPGTDREIFVMIVGTFLHWAIIFRDNFVCEQASLTTNGVVSRY